MHNALHPVLVISSREVRDQFRDWRIIFPIIGLTLLFPFLMNFTASQMLGFVNKYGATIIGERLIPFLLMIVGFFPISVSLVIALESFVGEKERGSIEPLLNTPLEDWQLYLGKLISSTVPPLLSSYLGMSVYLTGLVISHIPIPDPQLLILVVCMTTVQAFMMVAGAVVVSCQATSVRSANLLSSFIILPVAFLIQGESVVMFWGNYATLWWVVVGLSIFSILLIRVGLAHFQREELLGREIDVLNFRWGWRVFCSQFTENATDLADWYRRVIPATISRMRLAVLVSVIIGIGAVITGSYLVSMFPLVLPKGGSNFPENLQKLMEYWPIFSFAPALSIWWQNVRALLVGLLLGAFSFGILGLLPLYITLAIIGYLYQVLLNNGLPSALLITGLVLPHGIIEIPAAILATAAVVYAGARMATPTVTETFGETWVRSLADWTKIMIGVVMPLLALAALVETWITPQIAVQLFR
ncbi:stage II sporulation protein M [Leptolinea tardivitalis]|uniref:ABC-2 type transporter domain-containing protein n=1 Tax=Leptolinea tardivitalis TaxID=229920 RepID=A0A0P6XQI3_9CHLR|nr:stage II sporulation protein M [Leptolinea tardivitalis]KPL71710.1 hypothetical protein ADM99_09635 [Leptolinea tardivitalis]GAP20063.1 uncharacterized membrane protein [Leptolinea tardivitalis]